MLGLVCRAWPSSSAAAVTSKGAIVFFHQPNYDAVIETIPTCRDAQGASRYLATTSGEHFARKLAAMRGESS